MFFAVAVDTKYAIQDQFYQNSIEYQNNIPHMKAALHFMIFSGVLFFDHSSVADIGGQEETAG